MPNEQPNGFTRTFLKGKITPIAQISTKYPFEKFSGATNTHFFISVPNPKWLFMMNWDLTENKYFYFPVKVTENIRAHNVQIDSPNVYLMANNASTVLYSQLLSKKVDTTKLATSSFTRSEIITPNYLIIRGFDNLYKKQLLKQVNIHTGQIIHESEIVEGKNNLGFAEDGMLKFDSVTNKLIYIEYYKNNFFCFDVNLNLQYKGKTIDTTNTNSLILKDANVHGTDYIIPSRARIIVNSNCCINDGSLFVISGLIADNEKRSSFRDNSVVDIYQIDNGKYSGSFYIPNTKGQKVKSFFIKNKILTVLYANYLRTFKIN